MEILKNVVEYDPDLTIWNHPYSDGYKIIERLKKLPGVNSDWFNGKLFIYVYVDGHPPDEIYRLEIKRIAGEIIGI